jgi:hypothetical protein
MENQNNEHRVWAMPKAKKHPMDDQYKEHRDQVIQMTKENTNIPHDFIDKFMYLPENTLCINIEDIAQVLDVKKSSVAKTLNTSYNIIIDYHDDLVTPETFRNICFQSKKPNAAKIRRYYIEIEHMFINKFRSP